MGEGVACDRVRNGIGGDSEAGSIFDLKGVLAYCPVNFREGHDGRCHHHGGQLRTGEKEK